MATAKQLAPKDGEETLLASRRTTMMQGEKIASDLREAQEAVGGHHSPVASLSAAVRRLERLVGTTWLLTRTGTTGPDGRFHLELDRSPSDFPPLAANCAKRSNGGKRRSVPSARMIRARGIQSVRSP